MNEVYAVAVTDVVAVPRRTVGSQENCNACHENRYLHGGNRRSVEYCATCHVPNETMISNGVEVCVVCHGESKEFAPGKTSAVWTEIQLET